MALVSDGFKHPVHYWIGENTGGSSDGVATDEGQLTNDVQGDHIQIT